MMNLGKRKRILNLLYSAVDEVNQLLPQGKKLNKHPNEKLSGNSDTSGGKLDSLGLVNFIVFTEMKIEEDFGVTLILAEGQILAEERNPFETIESLAAYIEAQLGGVA